MVSTRSLDGLCTRRVPLHITQMSDFLRIFAGRTEHALGSSRTAHLPLVRGVYRMDTRSMDTMWVILPYGLAPAIRKACRARALPEVDA